MMTKYTFLAAFTTALFFTSCSSNDSNPPVSNIDTESSQVEEREGMVFIPGGTYTLGTPTPGKFDESASYDVKVDGYWIDETEVTNVQFREFVDATGYLTVAERPVDWEEIKKQLPPGTPKPHDSILEPGSLIFEPGEVANLYDISQWWKWENGADWQHPHGPGSSIEGKDNHPVVHIAFEDAQAYAEWAGKSLPTEVQWEVASLGGENPRVFTWDDIQEGGTYFANFFQGVFPYGNSESDGYRYSAPVKSYPPNGYGLYDMVGNVWEWTSDWYRQDTHSQNKIASQTRGCINPNGPSSSFDPQDPSVPKRVTKGGSFLCSDEYCSNYRPSSRMATAYDSGQEHLGFRCVVNEK